MIRNQRYVILESKEVRPGKAVGVTRLGEKLVLWRTAGGKLVCMVDRCPHLGAQLSQGQRSVRRKMGCAAPSTALNSTSTGSAATSRPLGRMACLLKR